MKKLIFLLIAISMVTCKNDTKNSTEKETIKIEKTEKRPVPPQQRKKMYASEIPFNFVGDFKGQVPCSDCDNIDISLNLDNDQNYIISGSLNGKENSKFSKKGKYTIQNYIITLDHDIDQAKYFYIVNQGLYVLNEKKQQIAGSKKEEYLITKK